MNIWDYVMRRKAIFLPLFMAFAIGGILGAHILNQTKITSQEGNYSVPGTSVDNYDYQPVSKPLETIHVAIVNPDETADNQHFPVDPSDSGELGDQPDDSIDNSEDIEIPHTGSDDSGLVGQIIDEHLGKIAASYVKSIKKQATAEHFSAWQAILISTIIILAIGIILLVLIRMHFLHKIFS